MINKSEAIAFIYDIFNENIVSLLEMISEKISDRKENLISNVFVTNSGLVISHVSFSNYQEDEQEDLDGMITVDLDSVQENWVQFDSEICLTSGTIIKVIISKKLIFNSLEDLLLEIRNLCNIAIPKMADEMIKLIKDKYSRESKN